MFVTTVAVLAACGGSADTPAPTASAPAAGPTLGATVGTEPVLVRSDIQNFTLQDLTIAVGDKVTWTHRDGVSHTTTAGRPGEPDAGQEWDSGTLSKGGSFSHTFGVAGTFPYFCKVHPSSMQATVTVVKTLDGQAPTSPPQLGAGSRSYDY